MKIFSKTERILSAKRKLSLIACAALCASLLCACSESGANSSSSSSAGETSAVSKAEAVSKADDNTSSAAESRSDTDTSAADDTSSAAQSESSADSKTDDETSSITPAMWKVTDDKGRTMTMLGSFHALKDECYPLPKALTDAYNSADILAVECDITMTNEDGEYMKNLIKQMLYNDGTTLKDHISEDGMKILGEYLSTWGMSTDALQAYRPWAVSSTLDSLLIQDMDFDSDKGIDNYLLELAHSENKEIYEVESVDFQMNMLINFSDDIYDLMFRSLEGETQETQKQSMEELYEAWKSGDTDKFIEEDDNDELAAQTADDEKIAEDYNNQMLYDRNKTMAAAIEKLLDEDKNVFYVVGAAHYVGEGGILDLLEKDGYTVERIEY